MKRTQIGWLIIAIVVIFDAFVLYQSRDYESKIILIIISLAVIILFFQLTLRVDGEYIRFSFGVGLIRGKYKLTDISYCRPISYLPLGLGIRFRPGVILFNVSGTKAIELFVRGKSRKVWIGTDYPDEIACFINSKITR
jgi:hypothetical protein